GHIRNGRRHRRPDIRPELLGGHRHEHRPETSPESQYHANPIQGGGRRPLQIKISDHSEYRNNIEEPQRFFPALHPLTDKPDQHISYRDGGIGYHDPLARIDRSMHLHVRSELVAKGDQDPDHIPIRQRYQYSCNIFLKPLTIREEHEYISPAYVRYRHVLIHP